jgi:hypothetical protein
MITGAGTPLADIITNAQAAISDARLSDSKLKNNKNSLLSSTASSDSTQDLEIKDTLELSDSAKASIEQEDSNLDLINQLQNKLSQNDVKLIEQRLDEINNQINIINELSSQSLTPEQEEIVNSAIKEIGQKLNSIAGQLGLVGNESKQTESNNENQIVAEQAEATQIIDEDNTNSETTNDTNNITIADSNNTSQIQDIDFVQASPSELNISTYDNFLPKSDVVKNSSAKLSRASLVPQFTFSLQSFAQLVEEFSASIDDENRIPPSMLKMIKTLAGSGEQNVQKENIIDTFA